MEPNKLKSFLKLEIIWKDDEMFEVDVSATNERYSGRAAVYDTTESLFDFAQNLIGFPNGKIQLLHVAGKKDCYAYFSMNFFNIDQVGHIGVEINLEENVATEFRPEEKSKVKLEIIVEPYAVDNFQKHLSQLALNKSGSAILYGCDNRLED